MIFWLIKTIFQLATTTVGMLTWMAWHYLIPPRLDPFFTDRPKRPLHDPPDFEQCIRLQEVLTQIRDHILKSTTTQQCYAVVCEGIKHKPQVSVDISVDDIEAHFLSTWPAFVPMDPVFMRYKDEVCWGRVDKECDDVNEIEHIQV